MSSVKKYDQLHTELAPVDSAVSSDVPRGPLVMTIVAMKMSSDATEEATSNSYKAKVQQTVNEEMYKHSAASSVFIPVVARKKGN
jgi:hypothetical protein